MPWLALLIAATVFNGLLAGANIDRLVVQMPAWRKVGVRAWADYSLRADLGNGLVLYPVLGIGGAALTIAAAVLLYTGKTALVAARLPAIVASILALLGLLATSQAAPRMLSLRRIRDEKELRRAFTGFDRWGALRAVFQILAFMAVLWALAVCV